MNGNAEVTLFNRHYDPKTRGDAWKSTHIREVSWMATVETVTGTGGNLIRENAVHIRIPEDAETEGKRYIPKALYTGGEEQWTLQNGDYVARGHWDWDGPISELMRRCGDVYQVTGFADNRRGGLPHFRVTGK